ncbi:MAG: TDP-N-acetylfucosamine:lipid II N-acetylfucosaminyltransferase [Bacteroidales bacterium]|nr:TDP-N-acetylfucosamine:lipid II N-acetylfucosaminyltransferase [Bacteroidales bacterium]
MHESKISILHLASDEKFINAANYIFEEAFPGCNEFIIPRGKFKRDLIHVKKQKNVRIVRHGRGLIKSLAAKTRHYDCVMLHGITGFNSSVFLAAKEKHKFVGILWGAELYTDENFPGNGLYGEFTASLNIRQADSSFKEKIKNIIRPLLYGNPVDADDVTKSAAARLSYLSSFHEEEFELFKGKQLISPHCQFIPFNYYPLEYITKGYEQSFVNGNNILLGNSATPTNNHLEAFRKLEEFNLGDRRIIVPLSYGNRFYADHIQSKGIEFFNGNLKALRDFLPLYEYTSVIQSCGIVIMNHYRQQGMGNINLMLWLGSKVYLNESNTYYQYLKRIGIRVFSIEKELVKQNIHALSNLSDPEILENRNILKKVLDEEITIDRLKDSLLNAFINPIK